MPEMTELDKLKIAYTDAALGLEIAQNRFGEARKKLLAELAKTKNPGENKPGAT